MSEYIKNLREQAIGGIELAGDDFTAEINIDCRNVIKLLDKMEGLEKAVEAAKKLYINSQEFYWNEEDGTYHASDIDDIHNLAEALSELNPQQEE